MAKRTLSKAHRDAISKGLRKHHAGKKKPKRSVRSRQKQSTKMKAHAKRVKQTNPKLWKKQRAAYFASR